MEDKTMCPCCGEHQFTERNYYECCPVCHWIDDLLQRKKPDYDGGANELSLNAYKAAWKKKKQAA